MSKLIKSVVDWFCAYITIQQFFAGSTVIGVAAISAEAASATDWINRYGPIAWLATAFIGAGITLFIFLGFAKMKYLWILADATKKWKEQVDSLNPLDKQFTRKRISIYDLVHPILRNIRDKTFSKCELIGPANIVIDGGSVDNVNFHDCDLVVIRDGAQAQIMNMVVIQNCRIMDSQIARCTIFIHPTMKLNF